MENNWIAVYLVTVNFTWIICNREIKRSFCVCVIGRPQFVCVCVCVVGSLICQKHFTIATRKTIFLYSEIINDDHKDWRLKPNQQYAQKRVVSDRIHRFHCLRITADSFELSNEKKIKAPAEQHIMDDMMHALEACKMKILFISFIINII